MSDDPRLRRVVGGLLDDLDSPMEGHECEQTIADLTTALLQAAGIEPPRGSANHAAVLRARDFLEANIEGAPTLADLEQAAQYDRWRLSRDFRALRAQAPTAI